MKKLCPVNNVIKQHEMQPIPSYGYHVKLEEFLEEVVSGCYTDYDGSGNFATKTEMSDEQFYPSELPDLILIGLDLKYTHVVWFNK